MINFDFFERDAKDGCKAGVLRFICQAIVILAMTFLFRHKKIPEMNSGILNHMCNVLFLRQYLELEIRNK